MTEISKTYISSLIPKGATILDVGSFNGSDAQELATACETEVHCFEPYPANYEQIKLLHDERLILWPYALGGFHGKVKMNIARGHTQSNSIKEPKAHKKVWPEIKYKTSAQILITTLDQWNDSQRGGKPIDFIWLDINGSEIDFLIGGARTLTKVSYLYIEFCVKELFDKSMNKEATIKALPGFEVIGEYSVGSNYGNLLFRNKNIQSGLF